MDISVNKKFNNNLIKDKKNLGVGEEGYICQLFKIFKNDANFCLLENKKYYCQFCQYTLEEANESINTFFQLSLDDLNNSGLDECFFNKYKTILKNFCPNCQKTENERLFPKCFVNYYVKSYPSILFVLFDSDYENLHKNKSTIIKLTQRNLLLEKNVKYSLIAIISTPNINHFTCFIVNYQSNSPKFNLQVGKNYLHDGCHNDGKFVELDENLNYLLDIYLHY